MAQDIDDWLALKTFIWCLVLYITSLSPLHILHCNICGSENNEHEKSIDIKDWLAYFKNGQWWSDTRTIHIASIGTVLLSPYLCFSGESVIFLAYGDYPVVLFGVHQLFKKKIEKTFSTLWLGKSEITPVDKHLWTSQISIFLNYSCLFKSQTYSREIW